mgnify:CR=1 FL=1
MATRSPSNKGITNRNTNVPPPARNYADNTQAVKRIPDVTYGEQEKLTEMQKMSPLPKEETPKASGVKRPFTPVDVFAETVIEEQPITDGASVGPGRMGATLTPEEKGDLYMVALANAFITTDTAALANDGIAELEDI